MFHVGQRVTCVNARHWPRYNKRVTFPVLGRTYAVRAILPMRQEGWDEDGIRLVEIHNPRMWLLNAHWTLRRAEVVFRQSRFRPLRATNIDVFEAMLEPVPTRERKPVDL